MSYTQIRNPPAPFTPPNQIHPNYVPQANRMPFMPPNQNNNVNLAAQQQQPQAAQQQAPPQQANQPNSQNQQQQQPNSQNPRMQPQPPQQSQQGSNNNSQTPQVPGGPNQPNAQNQQQQSQQNTQFQQMTPNMQQSGQQQPSGPQPQGIPSVPVPGSQPNHIPGQFSGYVNSDQHNANAAPFIYPTHQRMNLPQQSQQGNPQAPTAPSYSNYMYPQQYSQYHYLDPMVAQQYISQGGGYAPQGYIYAQNPAAVNMYNRGQLTQPTQGIQMQPQARYNQQQQNENSQSHQLPSNVQQQQQQQQTSHHQGGHHQSNAQVHPIIQNQSQNQQSATSNSQVAAHPHQAQQPQHPHIQPPINPQLVPGNPPPSTVQYQYNPAAPYVAAQIPAQPAPYPAKRIRKPLLIVDPTTKQPVNAAPTTEAKNESLPKSSTQPAICTSNPSSQTVASSASVAQIAQTTPSSTTPAAHPAPATANKENSTNSHPSQAQEKAPTNTSAAAPTTAQPTAAKPTEAANQQQQLNAQTTNSNENKKKTTDHQIQSNFALQVLKSKQSNTQAANPAPVTAAPTSQAPVTAASVVMGLAQPSKQQQQLPNHTDTQKPAHPTEPAKPQQTKPVPPKQQPEPTKVAVVEPAAPVQPSMPKVISYSNIVASSKPVIPQTVPKTAIPTARQTPPSQTPSTQNSITITNSNADKNGAPAQQTTANKNSQAQKQQPSNEKTKQQAEPTGAANKHSKAQNNKANSETDKKPTEVPVSAPEVPKEPTPEKQQPQQQQVKEDDKKKSVAQVITEATSPAVQPESATKAPSTTAPTKMPTVVSNNADTNKLNTLPDAPVVAEAKVTTPAPAATAAVSEPTVKKAQEPAAPVAKPAAAVVDCWTPENKDAKKRYNRDFLLSLKDKKLSKTFPDVLINFEMAVMEQLPNAPNKQNDFRSGSSYAGRSSFGGDSMNRDSSNYSNKGSMRREYKGSKKGSMHGNQPSVVINLPKVDVELKKTETPYVIKKLANENLNEEEELFRETRNILNKLTPQNLQKLTASLINLPITNEFRLKGCIDIIFEKAIDEQVFSQTYGQLSKVLSQIKVPSTNDPNRNVNFRTMLLTRCQKEFDTDYAADIKYDELVEEANNEKDEQKKKEMMEMADYKLSKAKRRSLGNIRFIGELFKLGMLTEGIMNDCIERLLKSESDEENIECLCRLLTTIGKEVDKPNNAAKMKSNFARLENITKKKDSTSARTRFMILDIIELRKNHWVPRRKDNAPRRIEEIRQEAEEERLKLEAQIAANQAHEKNMRNQQRGGGRGSGGYGSNLKSTSMDNEAFRGQKNQNINMVKKITEVKSITTKNNNEVLLGPGGGSSGFSWNKPAAAPSSDNVPTMTPSASFSSGSSFSSKYQNDDDRRGGLSNYNSTSQSRNFGSNKHQGEMTSRLSMDSNRGWGNKGQVQNVKRMDGSYSNVNNRSADSSRASSREGSASRPSQNSRENSMTRNVAAPSKSDVKTRSYTSDEIDRKVSLTLAEYIENDDISEALKDCEEFRPSKEAQIVEFCELALTKVLEKNEAARSKVGTLMYNILKNKKFKVESFTEALKNTLEVAEDMAIDVPKIATYLAQIIAPMFVKDFSVGFLNEACEPIKDKAICGDFISEVLISSSKRLGHSTVSEIFKASSLNINDFLKGVDNSAEFLKNKNIQWIFNGNRERTQSASVSSESYENKLTEILQSPKSENDVIFEKIENEFSDSDCQSRAFIRAVVTAVCRSCLDSNNKLDSDLLKKRCPILAKYIKCKDELELESLFAIQALDHKMQHQPGFIRVLFDMLYDEDIISEGVFWTWKKEAREEGHAISALSLKVFFEWLSEGDQNESS